jgi:hypothetical protein
MNKSARIFWGSLRLKNGYFASDYDDTTWLLYCILGTHNFQKSWSLKQTWVGWHKCLGTGIPHRRFLRIYSVCKSGLHISFPRATLDVNKSHSLTMQVYNLSCRQRYSVNSFLLFLGAGWDRVQMLLRLLFGLLYQLRTKDDECEAVVRISDGKLQYSKKTCPSAALPTTNPTWSDLGLNPGHPGGKSATNRLSYGTVPVQSPTLLS